MKINYLLRNASKYLGIKVNTLHALEKHKNHLKSNSVGLGTLIVMIIMALTAYFAFAQNQA